MTSGARPAQADLSLLLIDDDAELCEMLEEFFDQRGIRLETVNDGRRGLIRALGGGHDLVLLDVMLPDLDGFELLRLVRRQSQVPVIMLTARTDAGRPGRRAGRRGRRLPAQALRHGGADGPHPGGAPQDRPVPEGG